MSETPWYLVDHETMREYAEMVALYEALTGLPFDHARPFPNWTWPPYMQLLAIAGGRLRWVVDRALTDKARDLDCTFEELKEACLAECARRLAELPPDDDEPQSADPEQDYIDDQADLMPPATSDDNITPIWRM